MIRILHAADLHLDSPFEGVRAASSALRRGEQRDLLGRIAALSRSCACDLALLPGDLFDSERVYPETAELLCRALGAMEVPVFIAPGNHDFYGKGSRYASMPLPDNVHVFSGGAMERVELPALRARVWGAAFTDRYCSSLLSGFRPEKEPGVLDLMCLHGEVGAASSPYDLLSEAELAASGMDYIALGHQHGFSGLRRAGDTYYAWPGCPEGRGFDETGDKGVIIAEAEPGLVQIRFQPVCARRYEILRVSVSDADPAEAAAAALPQGCEKDIYRVVLTGESAYAPDLARVSRALEGRVFALQLRDETRIRRDIWERSGEDTLRGAFLKRLRERYDAAGSDAEREKITQAVRWGLAALDNSEEVAKL